MAAGSTGRQLRILASPADTTIESNPYIHLLYRAIERVDDVSVTSWSVSAAIRGSWDIVHLRWPELTASFSTPRRKRDIARFLAAVTVARVRGAKVAWTVHDLRPHDSAHNPWGERFYRLFARQVDVLLVLSETSGREVQALYPSMRRTRMVVIPHGHYRGVYPDRQESREVARQAINVPSRGHMLVFVGQIRPYKNVVALIRHFAEVSGGDDQLLVAGLPHQAQLATEIEEAAAGHPNVHLRLGHIPGSEMDRLLRSADAVVLPYSSILNSGTALLALSFDRPVVVPAVGSLRDLERDVGADWVRTYSGEFGGEVLRRALTETLPTGQPDLSAFDWDTIARSTISAYRSVVRGT